MKLNRGVMTLLPAMLAASFVCTAPAQAQSANAAPDNALVRNDLRVVSFGRWPRCRQGAAAHGYKTR